MNDTASDPPKHSGDHVVSANSVASLSDTYVELDNLLKKMHSSLSSDSSRIYELSKDAISQLMHTITQQTALTKSLTQCDLRAKAKLLLDWSGHEKTDLSDQLAASLARDVMQISNTKINH